MTLFFIGGKTSECKITKEGRKYVYFTATANGAKYRVIKETGMVQISPYWNSEPKMRVEF